MKIFTKSFIIYIQLIFSYVGIYAQETVTDYDGNVYNIVTIGDQVWLKENLKSLHYSDGTSIPGVLSYNNDDSLAEIYGRLYSWVAAMRDSIQPGVQGVCPCEWHIPTDQEWSQLENYLGGAAIAGGKMKDTGTTFWNAPNTGATNSSGFSALPAGEFDAYYNPNVFQLLNEYAVFWTSTHVSTLKARERYLAYNSSASSIYDWFKVMNYSIRCIKDNPTWMEDESIIPNKVKLMQNYPNPFNPSTTINFHIPERSFTSLYIFNQLGEKISILIEEELESGKYEVNFDASNLPSGVYFYRISSGNFIDAKKMLFIK